MEEIRTRQILAKVGFGEQARITKRMPDVGSVLAFYHKADCPMKNGKKREGKALKLEQKAIEHLPRLHGSKEPQTLTPADWQRYADRRLEEYGNGKGARTIDMEWATLSSAYRHAIRYQDETGITRRPLEERPTPTQISTDVRHCREFQPVDAEELHSIARYFLEREDSVTKGAAVFGWLTLLCAMIGQRKSEMLHLRTDASNPDEPGFNDGEHLWL